jgi:hypothetical protein
VTKKFFRRADEKKKSVHNWRWKCEFIMLDFKFTGTNEILKKALTNTSGAFTGQT